jgi:hypothetical protein
VVRRKAAAGRPDLSEAEIEMRVNTASGASALAGHDIGEEDREMARRVLRGEMTIEDAIEVVRRSVHGSD